MDLEIKVKTLETVNSLINSLTKDEDVRQNLWVYYLTGTASESLEARLSNLKKEHINDSFLQKTIWNLIQNPPSIELSNLIDNNFTYFESSIICCLMLGLSVSEISDIKGISEVRIRQSIAVIRYNNIWNKVYEDQKID